MTALKESDLTSASVKQDRRLKLDDTPEMAPPTSPSGKPSRQYGARVILGAKQGSKKGEVDVDETCKDKNAVEASASKEVTASPSAEPGDNTAQPAISGVDFLTPQKAPVAPHVPGVFHLAVYGETTDFVELNMSDARDTLDSVSNDTFESWRPTQWFDGPIVTAYLFSLYDDWDEGELDVEHYAELHIFEGYVYVRKSPYMKDLDTEIVEVEQHLMQLEDAHDELEEIKRKNLNKRQPRGGTPALGSVAPSAQAPSHAEPVLDVLDGLARVDTAGGNGFEEGEIDEDGGLLIDKYITINDDE